MATTPPFQLTRIMDSNDDMTFGQGLQNFATGAQACAQNVVTRLRTFMGEWFLDTSFGTPWHQDILIKPENRPLAEADLKSVILGTVGINSILSFSFTQKGREATVQVSVDTLYGTIEGIQVNI